MRRSINALPLNVRVVPVSASLTSYQQDARRANGLPRPELEARRLLPRLQHDRSSPIQIQLPLSRPADGCDEAAAFPLEVEERQMPVR